MIGVNLAGGEFGTLGRPYGVGYIYPSLDSIDYYASKGMEVIRLPFKWERLQPNENGPLDAAELGRIREIVEHAATKGMTVALDVHNYGMAYGGKLTGSAELPNSSFANLWSRVASEFKNDGNVMFNLMNEPFKHTAAQWLESANAAIKAIRDVGADQKILVPGTIWSGAHSWMSSDNHSVVGAGVVDPLNNYAFEVHQYLDRDSSGTSSFVSSETIGVERLKGITEWAKANGHELFLGEFGAAQDAKSLAALDNMLQYMQDNADVWIGATYWAGGPWWGDYIFSIEPDANGNDKPQMAILQKYDLKSPDRQEESDAAPVLVVEPETETEVTDEAEIVVGGEDDQDDGRNEAEAPSDPVPAPVASSVAIAWARGQTAHYDEGETMAFTITVKNAREGQQFDLSMANRAGDPNDFEGSLLDDLIAALPEGVSVEQINAKRVQITLKEGSYDFTVFRETAMDGVVESSDQAWWAKGNHEQVDFWLSKFKGGLTSDKPVASAWIRDMDSMEAPGAGTQDAVAALDPVKAVEPDAKADEDMRNEGVDSKEGDAPSDVGVPVANKPETAAPPAPATSPTSVPPASSAPSPGSKAGACLEKLLEQFAGKNAVESALARLDKIDLSKTGKQKFKGDGFEAGNAQLDVSFKFTGKEVAFQISGRIPMKDFDWMDQTLAETMADSAQIQHSSWDY